MPSIHRALGILVVLLSLAPDAASAQSGEEITWIEAPPVRLHPGAVDSLGATVTSPDEPGSLTGIPYCTAASGITCELRETGGIEEQYSTSSLQDHDIWWDITVDSTSSVPQTLTVTVGVEFEDGDGINVGSVSDDADIDIRDEYAWAVGIAESTFSASRGGSGFSADFRVDKIGSAVSDSVSFTCTVIAHPTSLGLADESCTAPSGYTRNSLSSNDTVTASGVALHQHGDSVHVKLTATSAGDPSAVADTVFRIILMDTDIWIREHPFTAGAGTIVQEMGADVYQVDGIEAVAVGADAVGTCSVSGATCEVRIDDGEELSDTLFAGSYSDDDPFEARVSGSLSEGVHGLELTLSELGGAAEDTDSLFFTVWDPTPVVAHVSTSHSTIGVGEQSIVTFTVADPGVANGATYDVTATWAGQSADVVWSDSTLTLSDTGADTVTVTLTGPTGGRSGVVELTATRQGGGESDSAQSGVVAATSVTMSVDVTALQDTVDIAVDSTGVVRFRVEIFGDDDQGTVTVDPTPTCGPVLDCTPPASISLTVGPPDTIDISVTREDVGEQVLWLKVDGDKHSQAWADSAMVVVAAPAGEAPNLASLDGMNAGDRFDRAACLSVSAGPIGIECDDAVFTYLLPPVYTFGQAWPLVLNYNSRTAYGELGVALEIAPHDSIPAGGYEIVLTTDESTPVTLATDTVHLDPAASLSERYRAVISDRDAAHATGLHPIKVEVTELFEGTATKRMVTLHDTVAVVNRSASMIGAGWSLSTDEQIIDQDSEFDKLLWVGADGSHRVYRADTLTANLWHSPEPFLGDSITKSGGTFTRHLRGGGKATFSGTGPARLHSMTTAWGRTIHFTHSADALTLVDVPVPGGDTTGYELHWAGSVLDSVSPAAIDSVGVSLAYNGSGDLETITMADGLTLSFGYADGLLTTITDADSVVTTISYTGDSGEALRKVDDVVLSASGETSATVDYTPSYPVGADTAIVIDSLKAYVDGPRSDVTDASEFWITGWGGAWKTLDAAGYTTEVEFGSPELDPRRVTSSTDIRGLTTSFTFDGDGRLATATADGATTTYTWNETWELPGRIEGPTDDFQDFGYNPNGLVTHVRYGHDSTVDTSLTETTLYDSTSVLVDTVYNATDTWQSFTYDALGNLHRVHDVLGLRSETTSNILGRVTRTEQVMDSTTTRRSIYTDYTYDVVGRTLTQTTYGETSESDTITVVNHYDPVGRVDSIQRTISPSNDGYTAGITNANGYSTLTSYWTYDSFGRVATRTEGTGRTAEYFTYDVAGNVIEVTTPRGLTIDMTYDALGRLTEQVVPTVTYALDAYPDPTEITSRAPVLDSALTCADGSCTFPIHPTDSTSYVIDSETITYTYSARGLTGATTADTEIKREYDVRGRLVRDSLIVTGWAQSTSGLSDVRETERYGIEYAYDDANRLDTLTLDDAASIGTSANTIEFAYNDASGTLEDILDRDTLTWHFDYDDARRLTQLQATIGGTFADTMTVSRTYDSSGRLTSRIVDGAGTETFEYTLSGQIDSVSAPLGDAWMNYTDLGHLGSAGYRRSLIPGGSVSLTIETFELDALGNSRTHELEYDGDSPPIRERFYDNLGRLVQIEVDSAGVGTFLDRDSVEYVLAPERLLQWYDDDGNVEWQEYAQGLMVFTDTASEDHELDHVGARSYSIARNYYDALGRLRARQRVLQDFESEVDKLGVPPDPGEDPDYLVKNRRGGFEEFVYDALGRRVAIRNRTINRDEGTAGPKALSFDGSTRLESDVNDHVGLGPVRKMTWAFWVDPDGDTSANLMYVSAGNGGGGPWWTRFNYSGGTLGVEMNMARPDGGAASVIHFGDLATDDWSFIVMEYDGTEPTAADRFTAYVDGSEVSWSLDTGASHPGEAITQRNSALTVGANFDGKLGDILVVQDAIADSATVADWYANGIAFEHSRLVAGYTWEGAETQDADSVSLADIGDLGNDLKFWNGSFPQAPDTTSDYASQHGGGYFDFGGSGSGTRLLRTHTDVISADSPDIMNWSFWLDPDTTKAEMEVMGVSRRGGAEDPVWTIATVENGTSLRLDVYNDSTEAMSSTYFDGLDPDTIQFVTVEFRGYSPNLSLRAQAWVDDVLLTKDSTVNTVPSRMATEGDTTRFEVGGLDGSSSDYFEGELGEVVVIPKLLSNNARGEWFTNGIAPLNTGTAPDTVYGVVKHYTWHDELTDQTSMGTDLSVAEGSISYVTSTYTTNFEATVDTTSAICDSACANSMTYVMWAGQQVLVEDRQRLDFTTSDSTYYGIVSYTHGGGIDRPLIAWRVDEAGDVCGVIPHFNWRGQFTERVENQVLPGGFVCTSEIPLTSRDFRRLYASYETPETLDPVWFGSLITGSTDGTGLQYRRARYYDPLVGQFTQIDPIGMRGGLNLYGYANGDPVNFRDPSGLAACGEGESAMDCLAEGGMTIDDWNNGVGVCEPWPECRFQEIADYWARRGGAMGWIGLNLAAGANGASEAIGTNDLFSSAQAGDGLGFVLAAGGMLPVGKFGKVGKVVSPGIAGRLTGFTFHGIHQIVSRRIPPGHVLEALRNGEGIRGVDEMGRISFRYVGEHATVVLNEAGRVITAWPGGWR